ncbi:MAG: TIGR01212 family radical SAM protein [Pseudomonadota bacterium]
MPANDKYRKLSAWLLERYGERVFKVSLRGGFTCPNRDGTVGTEGCTFCAGHTLEPVGYRKEMTIAEQLAHGIAYIRKRHKANRFIAYFQDYSATYAPVEKLAEIYAPVFEEPSIVAISVATRPDCLPPRVLDLLAEVANRIDLWVELGLQIANDDLLHSINRGHTVADFTCAVTECRKRKIPVCAQVILGLPGATIQDERNTARLLSQTGVWGVKAHAFHVLRNTKTQADYEAGRLRLLSQDEYAARVVDFVEHLPPDLVIHRLTGEAPRRFTVAPTWTINKMATFNTVVAALENRQTWQGRLFEPNDRP